MQMEAKHYRPSEQPPLISICRIPPFPCILPGVYSRHMMRQGGAVTVSKHPRSHKACAALHVHPVISDEG